jgi:folate-binding protein YgfZ
MNQEATRAEAAIPLPNYGVLRIGGPGAVQFLQGQFTNDTRLLGDGRTQISACCTSQGRTIAVAHLRQVDETIYALLPADIVDKVATCLRKFVLRAKVETVHAADLRIGAIVTAPGSIAVARSPFDEATPELSLVSKPGSTEVVTFQYAAGRQVIAATATAWQSVPNLSPNPASTQALEEWLAADIADGLPVVTAVTSEQFIPQMLNLDLLDGISFTKGCYTGQEIVARTQNLGRIKRRTLRYRLPGGPVPPPLAPLFRDGTKVAEVVLGADRPGSVELLAVTQLDARDRPLTLDDGRIAVPQPLPYAIPGSAA